MGKGFDTDSALSAAVITQAMANGYTAAGRYIHNATSVEVSLIHSHGMGLWLIDETSGNWAYFSGGAASGTLRGAIAKLAAQALGYPAGQYIASAVDFDATPQEVAVIDKFFAAYAAAIAPYQLMVYASGLVESSSLPAGAKAYLADAAGWSGTRGFDVSKAAIVQHLPTQMWGIAVDPCDINDESVVWGVAPPTSEVPSTPVNASPLADVMPALEDLQAALGVTVDGIWGPQTAAAVARYYEAQ